ncbi:hypothetical protein AGMMS50230_19070 [Spirochaetia bacterium]|nr:hypothetical protein AGMMS50230_19070 [Spirochaetia bacterium]
MAVPGKTFTAKPFPVEEADSRFAELARLGFNSNRLVLPWGILEHEGPGIYDEAYLAYLRKILLAAEKQNSTLWIDPCLWETSEDGPPAWTLEALGINTAALSVSKQYAAALMGTLFFAASAFAPALRLDTAIPAMDAAGFQDWMQTCYIEAFAHARRRLKKCSAISGWGTVYEAPPGLIGCRDLAEGENTTAGPRPSPFTAMVTASGYNPEGISIWKEGFGCPWKAAGIWDDSEGTPRLLKAAYFASRSGRPVSFDKDFLTPFTSRFTRRFEVH